jgi:hypothetical protein
MVARFDVEAHPRSARSACSRSLPRSNVSRAASLLLACAILPIAEACTHPSSSTTPCEGTVQSEIVNGSAQETYLGLSQRELDAIVQVVDMDAWSPSADAASASLCSGAMIAPSWAVTAAHCLQISDLAVIAVGSGAPIVLPVISAVSSPTEDVALLQLDTSGATGGDGGAVTAPPDAGREQLATMAVLASGSLDLSVGDAVELAGYGLTETNAFGSLHFVVEPIVAEDSATFTVDGFNMNGACDGDSGGPLLVRGPDGAPKIAGVLSTGSATCREDDHYARLDAISSWILATIGSDTTDNLDCGGITSQGRCFYGMAVWCAGQQVSAQPCQGGTECGWDSAAIGFRCVAAATDRCKGVDTVGSCVDNAASWCESGMLSQMPCGPCQGCRLDGKTGSPECAAVPSDE